MRRPVPKLATATLFGCLNTSTALAGMPSVNLSDMARMRFEAISFFLMGILVSAAVIQGLWNYLRRDFTMLPRLSYGRSLGVVVLWGLLFILVLTMISGARELLTPGAWKKDGYTYKLNEPPSPANDDRIEWTRMHRLDQLRSALWKYARDHDSSFPPEQTSSSIPLQQWQVPSPTGMRYLYVPGLTMNQGATPLAYEPEIFGATRLVLLTNGEIVRMSSDELSQALVAEKE